MLLLWAATLVSLAQPEEGSAQIRVGLHAVQAMDVLDGTTGVGARVGIQTPVLPFDLFATGEYFLPDCPPGNDGCGLRGASIEANFRMMVPLVRPYLTGGIAYREFTPGGGESRVSDTGVALGAGVDIGLGRARLFGEGRYEFLKAPDRQMVVRIGLIIGG
jgi:hypothetical protein